jgi:uncharacterized protein
MGMKIRGFVRMVVSAAGVVRRLLALTVACLVLGAPAAAQLWGDPFQPRRPPRAIPQQPQNPFGFGGFGGGGGGLFQNPVWEQQRPMRPRAPVPRAPVADSSKAPVPRKAETPPTTTILVMGDAMADWLGHGLEEVYADNPEVGVVRKIRANTGLLRNESRTESYDWIQSAREFVTHEKADFVVIMLGLSDRQPIRERQSRAAGPQGTEAGQAQRTEQSTEQGGGTHEFRSAKWGELYSKRFNEMVAAVKSKGIPVLWVGLAPIRGPRAKIDLTYLNEIYKASAEKAGISYIDVWDGFADEDGNFSLRGPDYNGQIRPLRSGDGVYFTKAGALKLGHYVEREIQRLLATRGLPVALPAPEPLQQAPAKPGAPALRPVAGPVVPLTGVTTAREELAGSEPARAASPDPISVQVLVRGEAVPRSPGRADDFAWPLPDAAADAIIPVVNTSPVPPIVQRPALAGKKAAPTVAPAEQRKTAPKRQAPAAATTPPPAAPAFGLFGATPPPARPPR